MCDTFILILRKKMKIEYKQWINKIDLYIQRKRAYQNPGSNERLETQLVLGIYLYLYITIYVLMHWHESMGEYVWLYTRLS